MAKIEKEKSKDNSLVEELVNRMNLEEKARILSGNGAWRTHEIKRLDIPSIRVSDGPHGLRKVEDLMITDIDRNNVMATCFPTASALASTWNTGLIQKIGSALGREAQANDVQILLGPGVNMKRSPLGGRNFEYFSEDPLLSGKMAVAYIKGVQGEGVGTSLKHFAVNNQEFERMATSSNLDERTLHEIYLPAFEMAVTEARPWTVMSAYNSVNGCYASEHSELLTGILRDKWGFEGFVVSDWGAINDRVKSIKAGTNLEMPGSGDYNRNKIMESVKNGILPIETLDNAVAQLLSVVLKARVERKPDRDYDKDIHNILARQASEESIVLLKNKDNILPLNASKIAVIGTFAKNPRYQGAGSSRVSPTMVSNAYDELCAIVGNDGRITYTPGYDSEGNTTEEQIARACRIAELADVAVIFTGLPDGYESEGFDRSTLDMPDGHNLLIDAVSTVQSNCVVILMNGSAVTMPWVEKVKGVIEGWLGGQASGCAIANVLTGKVNPSGKLSETFPCSLRQTPTYPNFPARHGRAEYGECLFIGYRYYDKKQIKPLFPFGFGLSYTKFEYVKIHADSDVFNVDDTSEFKSPAPMNSPNSEFTSTVPVDSPTGEFTIEIEVKNVGDVTGKEVVQLYISERQPCVIRPECELRAFSKVELKPGEKKTVTFSLTSRDFAYYNLAVHDWEVNPGKYDVLVGNSSRDLPLRVTVNVRSKKRGIRPLSRQSMIKEFLDHPQGQEYYEELVKGLGFTGQITSASTDEEEQIDLMDEQISAERKAHTTELALLNDIPVNKIPAFSRGKFSDARLDEILMAVNN